MVFLKKGMHCKGTFFMGTFRNPLLWNIKKYPSYPWNTEIFKIPSWSGKRWRIFDNIAGFYKRSHICVMLASCSFPLPVIQNPNSNLGLRQKLIIFLNKIRLKSVFSWKFCKQSQFSVDFFGFRTFPCFMEQSNLFLCLCIGDYLYTEYLVFATVVRYLKSVWVCYHFGWF